MKYLNEHKEALFAGERITYRGKTFWANITPVDLRVEGEPIGRVFATSAESYRCGVINGYEYAVINANFDIVPCKG